MQQINESYVFKSKMRRKLARFFPLIKKGILVICVLFIVFFSYVYLFPAVKALSKVIKSPTSAWSIVSNEGEIKSTNGRTNILLLGIGDPNHDGPNLSDTIIVVSINLKTYDIAMISIPRDIWIPSLKEKINAAYAIGEAKQKDGGFILADASVTELLNIPIHYSARINFSGFKKAIDLVGGLDINVENTIDDYKYPIDGKENDPCENDPEYKCRYEHLHIDKGIQHMNGELALKYVRSRHAEGTEGSDFARSKRQQTVLIALKNKLLSANTILDPKKVNNLLEVFGNSVSTDINAAEGPKFIKLAAKINGVKIRSFPLDTGDETASRSGVLINPPVTDDYGGAWVLVPKDGSWEKIQQQLQTFLK
jgi:polyisoprenyl-teichoic acid--peptidoglycan teichoic acid transferase